MPRRRYREDKNLIKCRVHSYFHRKVTFVYQRRIIGFSSARNDSSLRIPFIMRESFGQRTHGLANSRLDHLPWPRRRDMAPGPREQTTGVRHDDYIFLLRDEIGLLVGRKNVSRLRRYWWNKKKTSSGSDCIFNRLNVYLCRSLIILYACILKLLLYVGTYTR